MRAAARVRASLAAAEAREARAARDNCDNDDDDDDDGGDVPWWCITVSPIPAVASNTRRTQKQYPSTGTRSVVGCLSLLVGTGW